MGYVGMGNDFILFGGKGPFGPPIGGPPFPPTGPPPSYPVLFWRSCRKYGPFSLTDTSQDTSGFMRGMIGGYNHNIDPGNQTGWSNATSFYLQPGVPWGTGVPFVIFGNGLSPVPVFGASNATMTTFLDTVVSGNWTFPNAMSSRRSTTDGGGVTGTNLENNIVLNLGTPYHMSEMLGKAVYDPQSVGSPTGNSTGNGILIDDNLNVQVDLGGSTGTGGGPGGVYGKFGKGG